jgi:hypothetical protein
VVSRRELAAAGIARLVEITDGNMRPLSAGAMGEIFADPTTPLADRMIAILRGLAPESLNIVMQDMPPAFVERAFAMLEEGETCAICEERRTRWARMAGRCRHKMCAECAARWAGSCAVAPEGHGCPDCTRAGVARAECLVDPRLMFGAEGLRALQGITTFVSFQLPALQTALDLELRHGDGPPSGDAAPTIHRCPGCSTVSVGGNACLRRCHNPQCAMEFCLKCNCEIDAGEDGVHARHVGGSCAKIAAETAMLAAGKGLTACPGCRTMVWHATYHGCHCVRCPSCAAKFCHACAVPYDQRAEHMPNCRCPIFCTPAFACRCSKACPECDAKKCEHCDGCCESCVARAARAAPPHASGKREK